MILQENTKQLIRSSEQSQSIFRALLDMRPEEEKHKEYFYVMGLNAQNVVLYIDLVTMGTVNQANPIVRECVRVAILKNAVSIIVSHNHPSGESAPSNHDKEFTVNLSQACKVLGINLLDHIIVGDGYYSFSDNMAL